MVLAPARLTDRWSVQEHEAYLLVLPQILRAHSFIDAARAIRTRSARSVQSHHNKIVERVARGQDHVSPTQQSNLHRFNRYELLPALQQQAAELANAYDDGAHIEHWTKIERAAIKKMLELEHYNEHDFGLANAAFHNTHPTRAQADVWSEEELGVIGLLLHHINGPVFPNDQVMAEVDAHADNAPDAFQVDAAEMEIDSGAFNYELASLSAVYNAAPSSLDGVQYPQTEISGMSAFFEPYAPLLHEIDMRSIPSNESSLLTTDQATGVVRVLAGNIFSTFDGFTVVGSAFQDGSVEMEVEAGAFNYEHASLSAVYDAAPSSLDGVQYLPTEISGMSAFEQRSRLLTELQDEIDTPSIFNNESALSNEHVSGVMDMLVGNSSNASDGFAVGSDANPYMIGDLVLDFLVWHDEGD